MLCTVENAKITNKWLFKLSISQYIIKFQMSLINFIVIWKTEKSLAKLKYLAETQLKMKHTDSINL